jgi:hypothetical protein
VEKGDQRKDGIDLSRAPRNGVRLMVVILLGLALLAVYANVQKIRRDQIETVTITPVSSPSPSPASSRR